MEEMVSKNKNTIVSKADEDGNLRKYEVDGDLNYAERVDNQRVFSNNTINIYPPKAQDPSGEDDGSNTSKKIQKNEKKWTARVAIILAISIAATITGLIGYHIYTIRKLKEKADKSYLEGNYLDAAEEYDSLSKMPGAQGQLYRALCREAICYYQMGRDAEDENERERYFQVGDKLCRTVFEDENSSDSPWREFSLSIINDIYISRRRNPKDEGWISLISQMEDIESSASYVIDDEDDVEVMKQLYQSLISYYLYLQDYIQTDEAENNKRKIRSYYGELIGLVDQGEDAIYTFGIKKDARFVGRFADVMIDEYVDEEDKALADRAINDAIELCEEKLNGIGGYSETNEYVFATLNRVRCKGYWYLSGDNSQIIYDIAEPFFVLNSSDFETQSELFNLSYYAILTGMCTDKNIDCISSNYRSYYDAVLANEESITIQVIRMWVMAMNSIEIINRYGFNDGIYSIGLDSLDYVAGHAGLAGEAAPKEEEIEWAKREYSAINESS